MIIKLDTMRIKNIARLMKGVRTLLGEDVDTPFSKESILSDTLIYTLEYPTYTGLLMIIGGKFFFIEKTRKRIDRHSIDNSVDIVAMPDGGLYAAHLILEDWTDSDFVRYDFEPDDYITYPNVFTGTFIDACKRVLDYFYFWMS